MGMEATIVINLTPHCEKRCQQRGYNVEEIVFVVEYGMCKRNAGVSMYFLRWRDIPRSEHNAWSRRLVNTAVLLDERTNTALTVYRNPNALKDHRRKAKYRHRAAG